MNKISPNSEGFFSSRTTKQFFPCRDFVLIILCTLCACSSHNTDLYIYVTDTKKFSTQIDNFRYKEEKIYEENTVFEFNNNKIISDKYDENSNNKIFFDFGILKNGSSKFALPRQKVDFYISLAICTQNLLELTCEWRHIEFNEKVRKHIKKDSISFIFKNSKINGEKISREVSFFGLHNETVKVIFDDKSERWLGLFEQSGAVL